MNIQVEYDGAFPNLCRGNLAVVIDGQHWEFPSYCLRSGGYVRFDENWREHVGVGQWSVYSDCWPEDFPESMKESVLEAINKKIPYGCCGGCV